jgi:hypothetical protein
MRKAKRAKLERAGWKVGTARGFLGLSNEEARFIELELTLPGAPRRKRERRGLSQTTLAKRRD